MSVKNSPLTLRNSFWKMCIEWAEHCIEKLEEIERSL